MYIPYLLAVDDLTREMREVKGLLIDKLLASPTIISNIGKITG